MSCFTRSEKLLNLGSAVLTAGIVALVFSGEDALRLPPTLVSLPLLATLAVLAKLRGRRPSSAVLGASLSALAASPALIAASSLLLESVRSGSLGSLFARDLLDRLGGSFYLVSALSSLAVFFAALLLFATPPVDFLLSGADQRYYAGRLLDALSSASLLWSFLGFISGFAAALVLSRLGQAERWVAHVVLLSAVLASPLHTSFSLITYLLLPLPPNGLLLGAALGSASYMILMSFLQRRQVEASGESAMLQVAAAILVLVLVFFTFAGPAFPQYMLAYIALLSLVLSTTAVTEGYGASLSIALVHTLSLRIAREAASLLGLSTPELTPFLLVSYVAALARSLWTQVSWRSGDCEVGVFPVLLPLMAGFAALPLYPTLQLKLPQPPPRLEVSMVSVLLPLVLSVAAALHQRAAVKLVTSALPVLAVTPLHPSGLLLAALFAPTLGEDRAFLVGLVLLATLAKLALVRAKPGRSKEVVAFFGAGAGLLVLASSLPS